MNIDLLRAANQTILELKHEAVAVQLQHDEEITAIEDVNDAISVLVNEKFKRLVAEVASLQSNAVMAEAAYKRLLDTHDRLIASIK